jgi:hypothetical protein
MTLDMVQFSEKIANPLTIESENMQQKMSIATPFSRIESNKWKRVLSINPLSNQSLAIATPLLERERVFNVELQFMMAVTGRKKKNSTRAFKLVYSVEYQWIGPDNGLRPNLHGFPISTLYCNNWGGSGTRARVDFLLFLSVYDCLKKQYSTSTATQRNETQTLSLFLRRYLL